MLNRRNAATIPTTAKMIPRMSSDRNMVVTLMLTVRLLALQEYAIWPFPDENANLCTVIQVYNMYCKFTSCNNSV